MAYNGSGTFQRIHSWVADKTAGIKIRADRMDEEFDGIAAALSNAVTRDGQSPLTADLPVNGKRLLNVGAPQLGTDGISRDVGDGRYGKLASNDKVTGRWFLKGKSTGGMATTTGSLGAAEVQGAGGAGDAAFLSFHRPGAFASYFGVDSDNKWKVGGWSAGAVAHELWHAGNKPNPVIRDETAAFYTVGGDAAALSTTYENRLTISFVAKGPRIHATFGVRMACSAATAANDMLLMGELWDTASAGAANRQEMLETAGGSTYGGVVAMAVSIGRADLVVGRTYELRLFVRKGGADGTYTPANMHISGINL